MKIWKNVIVSYVEMNKPKAKHLLPKINAENGINYITWSGGYFVGELELVVVSQNISGLTFRS